MLKTLTAAAVMMASACSGDDSTTSSDVAERAVAGEDGSVETTELSRPVPLSTDASTALANDDVGADAVGLLTAMFSGDLDSIGAAIERTVPGSPAHRYGVWQYEMSAIYLQDRADLAADTVTRSGDSVVVCREPAECAVYSNFVMQDGRFESFSVDDHDLALRLGGPSEPVTVGPLTVLVTSSYQVVPPGGLGVLLEPSTTAPIIVPLSSATYIDPDGQRLSEPSTSGPFPPEAEATWRAAAFFPPAAPGGRLVFDAHLRDGSETYSIEVAVPALRPPT